MKITELFERGEFVVICGSRSAERISCGTLAGGGEDLSERHHRGERDG